MTCLRIVLGAIDHYTKDLQDTNLALKVVLKFTACCLWCFDKTIKFITFYGFIFVAVEGSSFCSACMSTFSFIIKYPAQLATNTVVGNILTAVISLTIPLACGAIGFIWVSEEVPEKPSPLYAAIAILIPAFFIASAITDVFKCCIDTIFVCAFKDLETNMPPKFMSADLRKGFGLEGVNKAEDGPKIEKAEEVQGI